MEDADIEQRFHLMQKEIEGTLSLMRENKLDLMAAIDSIKIELEVLKTYMERFHPVLRSPIQSSGKRRSRRSILNG